VFVYLYVRVSVFCVRDCACVYVCATFQNERTVFVYLYVRVSVFCVRDCACVYVCVTV